MKRQKAIAKYLSAPNQKKEPDPRRALKRITALAKFLGIPTQKITICPYQKSTFDINLRTEKRGTSPQEAKRLVKQLREVLRSAIGEHTDKWDTNAGIPLSYKEIIEKIRRKNPKSLEIGCHEVANTLYFLTDEFEYTLCEAFNGIEPTDRRTDYTIQDSTYTVLTDKEATKATIKNIAETLWAFSPVFLQKETGIPKRVFSALQSDEETPSTKPALSTNEIIRKLIHKTCGLRKFCQAAIKADGRGHFLNSYNGEEETDGYFYFYRSQSRKPHKPTETPIKNFQVSTTTGRTKGHLEVFIGRRGHFHRSRSEKFVNRKGTFDYYPPIYKSDGTLPKTKLKVKKS